MLPPPLPRDPNEWPEPDATELAATLAGAIRSVIRHQFEYGPTPEHALRDAHAKTVGLVRATLKVTTKEKELHHGILQPDATYPAWVRFSNGDGNLQSDTAPDGRGMAIKLMGIEGERLPGDTEHATQDIVMIDCPMFFVRNARDYVDFVHNKAAGHLTRFLFPSWQPWRWRLRELGCIRRIKQRPPNVIGRIYHSMTPFRLGPHVVKWVARPAPKTKVVARRDDSYDSLAEALKRQLDDGPVTYELCVQRRGDKELVVEDATCEWTEADAPYEKVAELEIPKQDCAAPGRFELADRISWSPWHCLAVHRPLGSLNRIRRAVYFAASDIRHDLNRQPTIEPTGDEAV